MVSSSGFLFERFANLPDALPLTGTENVPIVQNGKDVKTTTAALQGFNSLNYGFITVGNSGLPSARQIVSGPGINITDNGAGSTLVIGTSGNLLNLASLATNGIIAFNSGSFTSRTLVSPAAGFTITNADGVSGNPTFALSNGLASLEALSGVGFVTQIGADTFTMRSLVGTTNQISIGNGDGVSGAPTLSISNDPVLPGTGSVTLPIGSTGQRPGAPVQGMVRYNSSFSGFEGYTGSGWGALGGGGTVTSVSGTANRITSTGGISPVIDISAAYVGQSSITTVGTIGSGTWQGTAIADTYISSSANWNAKISNISGLITAGASISITGSGTSGSPYVISASGSGFGTVTNVSVTTANGFSGSVATSTSTPAITISTTITGIIKGNGTAISAAVAGVDYQAPITLTTTGSSGAATLIGNVLNIPQYAGGSVAFSAITTGSNTTAAMTVGSGGSLTYSGTGTITATHAAIANEATDTTCFPLFVTTATGDQAVKSNATLTYNSNTGNLGSVTFTGAFVGNVTGNVSGSSGSTTGNAATVTTNANLTGDVTSVGNATSIAAGVIVNADVNAAAGILLSKTNISLTTTGTSGAATLNTTTGVLNVPNYAGGGSGTVNSGTANQVTYYATTGTAVSGNANFTSDSAGNVAAAGTLAATGALSTATRFNLGSDVSIAPVVGGQSYIGTYWGMQLGGNQQVVPSGVSPANVGSPGDYGVIVLPGPTASISFMTRLASSQSGAAYQIQNSSGTPVYTISAAGAVTLGTWNGTAIGPTFGGTNQTSWTTGDLLYATGSNTLGKRAIGSTNDVLTVVGGVPTWSAPSGGSSAFSALTSSTNTTAAMVVGTGASLTTSGSGTITATAVPVGGISGVGTGVATALAVNTGTSGAFVVNGGALGTPSSGVATNLTGTASGLTAATVTTNANLTGDVTSVGNATSIAAGVIVNADVNAAAGILLSKTNISLTTTGTSGAATLNTTTGVLNVPNYAGGGGGSPGGVNTNIQFNNAGSFGGSSKLVWDNATEVFFIGDVSGTTTQTNINAAGISCDDAINSSGSSISSIESFLVTAYANSNSIFNIDGSAGSAATGIEILSASASSGVTIRSLSTGTNEDIIINPKGNGAVTLPLGGSTTQAQAIVGANVNTTAVGNVGTGTDDLITYSLPANAMNVNGRGIRITAWGSIANNATAKTLTLNFGSTVIFTRSMSISAANRWSITALVFRTGSNAQDYQVVTANDAATSVSPAFGTSTQTDTAAITVKCTGNANANNDIVQEGLLVEMIN